MVRAHADRLERVIGHLVQNAAEATPQDGRIGVRLRREGEQAVIEIEDNGKGMSERFIRESLFRPFASTKEHGMGIGTFESRDYIRELGGALEVASREKVGTTFRIRLPLQSSTHAPARPGPGPESPVRRGRRIAARSKAKWQQYSNPTSARCGNPQEPR